VIKLKNYDVLLSAIHTRMIRQILANPVTLDCPLSILSVLDCCVLGTIFAFLPLPISILLLSPLYEADRAKLRSRLNLRRTRFTHLHADNIVCLVRFSIGEYGGT
jgi:hypothetical protein